MRDRFEALHRPAHRLPAERADLSNREPRESFDGQQSWIQLLRGALVGGGRPAIGIYDIVICASGGVKRQPSTADKRRPKRFKSAGCGFRMGRGANNAGRLRTVHTFGQASNLSHGEGFPERNRGQLDDLSTLVSGHREDQVRLLNNVRRE